MAERKAAGEQAEPALLDLHIQMLKLSTMLSRPMQVRVADPHDLAVDDIKLMVCLSDQGKLTGREISDLLALNPMAASRSIDRLEERGLLERHADAGDRRKRPVSLSEDGRRVYASLQPDIGAVAELLYGGLRAAERRTLFSAIAKVLESPAFDQPSSTQPPST